VEARSKEKSVDMKISEFGGGISGRQLEEKEQAKGEKIIYLHCIPV
jgi:hypothetical protein